MVLRLTAALIVFASPAIAGPSCTVFENAGFGGALLEVPSNQHMSKLNSRLDNKISSVRVSDGCILVAYADPEFKGATQTFGPGAYDKLPADWNDVISSLECNCR